MVKRNLYFFFILILLTSCVSEKKLIYLQGSSDLQSNSINYQNTLQPDDKLLIMVTAEEPELAADFNILYINAKSSQTMNINANDDLYTYLIDQQGDIDFPVIGKIHLAGFTRVEAEAKLKTLLETYIKDPGVSIRVINFKVSVIGEVTRPGPQLVPGDRITIFEAISAAGDLTIYGNRKAVVVIREKDGEKIIEEVDITNSNIVNSEYYYLAHNDVIYVKPNKTRINSSAVGPNLTVGLSALSLLVTIIALSTR